MAYISYNKLWESEFDGFVSKREKLQDLSINQLKLEVHDTYKKDEKLTTNFEPTDNLDVINKGYLDEKIFKNKRSLIKIRKRLQRTQKTIQQTICRRNFSSKSCKNDNTNII